jgi:hypothetical protein
MIMTNGSVMDYGELNLESLKMYQEEFDINPIFRYLHSKTEYSKEPQCFICIRKRKTMFGADKNINCAFCGKTVCKECAPKVRRDPRPPISDDFFPICKVCDHEYLRTVYA